MVIKSNNSNRWGFNSKWYNGIWLVGKLQEYQVTKGTKNSHSAIVAKQHEVPAAIISDISGLQDGDFIAIDTNSTQNGELYYYPSENELKDLLKKMEILKYKKKIYLRANY